MELQAIEKLIEIDEATRSHVESVHAKKFALKKQIDEEKDVLSKKSWDDVSKALEEKKQALDQENYELALASQKDYDAKVTALKKMFETNHDAWLDMLVEQVIGFDKRG